MQIAPYIEGQRLSLEDLVQALSQSAVDDPQAVQNKIKNILFTEATRKSYCHDKRADRTLRAAYQWLLHPPTCDAQIGPRMQSVPSARA